MIRGRVNAWVSQQNAYHFCMTSKAGLPDRFIVQSSRVDPAISCSASNIRTIGRPAGGRAPAGGSEMTKS